MELWHEKYGIGTVTGIEDSQTGKIISVDFNGDERKFLYPTAMDVNLFTLDKVPKDSRYYKVMQERIEKEKKESLLLKRQERLHSRESVVISCENEIEKDEERKIRELRKPANTEMEKGVTVGATESYDDEGISGTSVNHRVQFLQMIQDAEGGKIDMIVTKSISRFARNTLDCISYVRRLKALKPPVGVFFEMNGYNTLDTTSETFLTLLSTVRNGFSTRN